MRSRGVTVEHLPVALAALVVATLGGPPLVAHDPCASQEAPSICKSTSETPVRYLVRGEMMVGDVACVWATRSPIASRPGARWSPLTEPSDTCIETVREGGGRECGGWHCWRRFEVEE
jgi:hypothetical protein